jgi:photosystem II stability/assembly factor-like uncharacterized protein
MLVAGMPAAAPAVAQAADPAWVRTGGPPGGLGYDVRMRPDDPDVMFVTDAWAGVFRSDDGAETWHPVNEGITTRAGPSGDAIPIFSLTIDPHDPDIVWAGTQNVRGIFKSTDGGFTWTETVNGVVEDEGITFRGFTVDPRSSDIVYAAAEVSSWVWSGEPRQGLEWDMTAGVVYKTIDGGDSWFEVWRGDNLARYVWIDPDDPDVAYLSTGIFDREAANSVPESRTAGGVGVVKSSDAGATWTEVNDGMGNLYVGTLFMHPFDHAMLLAGTGNNRYYVQNGAYLTDDGAASWSRVLSEDNISAVEFTSDPEIAYAGSERAIYRSEDRGRTWELVTGGDGWGPPGVRAGFPIDLQADPRDPDRVFVNNYGGGNFVTTDGGRSWEAASTGYTGALTRAVDADPSEPGRVYAAVRSGLFVSDDGGSTWRGLGFGPAHALEFHAIAVDPADSRHLVAASNWAPVLLASHDGGRSWEHVGPQLDEGMAWRVVEFAAAEPSVLYAGSGAFFSAGQFDDEIEAAGIYASRDGGGHWEPINTDVTAAAQIADLAVHPEHAGFVYAASSTHGLMRTFDGGLGWEQVTAGLPGGARALSVAFDPRDPKIQLAGFIRHGLYRSDDEGDRWVRIAAGLNPESTISDIVFHPSQPGLAFAADVHSGVYRSDDAGLTWRVAAEGLRTRAVNALALSADGAHLYAATEGEGVYRLDLVGAAPVPAEPLWVLDEEPPAPAPTTTAAASVTVTTMRPDTTAVPVTTTVAAASDLAHTDGTPPWVLYGIAAGGALVLALVVLTMRRRRV